MSLMAIADYLVSFGWVPSTSSTLSRNDEGEMVSVWPNNVRFRKGLSGDLNANCALEIERMSKVLIYDLEIKRAIYEGEFREEGIEYAEGWEDYASMGIPVLAVWCDWLKRTMVFGDDNLSGFKNLVDEADALVGFNNKRFDDRVLAANGIEIPKGKGYDICVEFQMATGKRCKLDHLSMSTLGVGKSDDGALAPILWQRGERFRVINYCIHDVVAMTVPLFDLIRRDIALTHPYNKSQVFLRNPISQNNKMDNEPSTSNRLPVPF